MGEGGGGANGRQGRAINNCAHLGDWVEFRGRAQAPHVAAVAKLSL